MAVPGDAGKDPVAAERWNRIKGVLSLALKRGAAERPAVLDAACGADEALRREVEDLLDAHDQMGSFLEEPLVPDGPPDGDHSLPPDLQQWSQYQITHPLGSGGMAVVYKAWDPRLHRFAAIKVISAGDDLTIRRFLREAEAQARIDHENVLKVYETGVVGRHHYIAMQYVNGPTLVGVREETTLERKVELMLQIAEGLHAAHRQGLVHRDIKPGNILVERCPEGLKPYLLDFGLAVEVGAPALTMTGVVVGTPRYMAPERIHGGAATLDRRSDIYSLGATFYELISGAAPFASTSGLQVLVDVLEHEMKPLRAIDPTLPPEIEAIVGKCLEKDPQRRYPSARALADDLRRYLNGEPVLARPETPAARLARKVRKHPRTAAAFATLLTVTLAAAVWGSYVYWRASRQAELAQSLGQEIRDLEWLYRAAQMSPLHPIEAERRQVRERMARLTRMMGEVGSIGIGPGHYALGRASLTLGDSSQALQHLQRAWDAGYRTPDTAAALGLAHGEFFRVELARAQRIETDRERNARIRDLEAAHRDRALYFLSEGRTSTIVPARYIEALTASHRDDVRAAVDKAEAAARETPWLFEAYLLAGHLEFREAVRIYLSGQVGEAVARATEADRHYAAAQGVAESAIDAHLGRCGISGLVLHMAMHGLSTDPQPQYQLAEEACSRALVIDPGNAEAYRLLGEAVRFWGNGRVQRGLDPGEAYSRSAELARRALDLSGGNIDALLALADTFLDYAWWESRRGQDPRTPVEQAVSAYEKALAVDPRNVTAAHNMGLAFLLRGRFEVAHGHDPLPAQGRAVDSFQRGLRADPMLAFGFRNLAGAAIERADEQRRRGLDAASGLEQVARFIEQLPGDAALPDRVQALEKLRAARN